jgi:hypothetical protein
VAACSARWHASASSSLGSSGRDRARDLERCAGGEARAGRHRRGDDTVEPAAAELRRDGVDVSGPSFFDLVQSAQRHSVARPRGDHAFELDRRRQDEPLVVVGVVADQIDALRRADTDRQVAPAGCLPVELVEQPRHGSGR